MGLQCNSNRFFIAYYCCSCQSSCT
uniref:Uncharacterized protein n=1 Tax=Anguilla anguilla TaxID=7936 RepID=A0A0E9Q2Y2_ANGAN